MGKLQVVVGGQFGSEGKGAIAGFLAAGHRDHGVSIRVAGPNAGHTVLGKCPPTCPERSLESMAAKHWGGRHPWKLQQVPVAAVTNREEVLIIAAGSEIDLDLLHREIEDLDSAGYAVSTRLHVHPSATIISKVDVERETLGQPHGQAGLTSRIGSTGKGVGAARAARVMRSAVTAGDIEGVCHMTGKALDFLVAQVLGGGGSVLVEGTQGYGLGVHTTFYPYTTSSDCRAIDFLAMAGISPWQVLPSDLEIWVVFRTFPIRVAGNSGPMRDEATWESLSLPPEYTTVTKKLRRVGLWDPRLASDAVQANGGSWRGPVRVALTMADQYVQSIAGATSMDKLSDQSRRELTRLISKLQLDIPVPIQLVGTGPSTLIDLR